MRLKTGKEYFDPFFPGYVFFETDESDSSNLKILEKGKGFQHFLPSNQNITPLVMNDLKIVKSILSFGSTVGIQKVLFDEGDRILITEGPFKEYSGKIVAVNRRNKRLNINLDFMGTACNVSLSYEMVTSTTLC